MATRLTASALVLVALVSSSLAALSSSAEDQAPEDRGKVSGLISGDYFSFGRHHDSDVQGRSGGWARLIFFTYDHRIAPGWSLRLRYEAMDRGDFSGENDLYPYLKDAWVRYTSGGHSVLVGVQPTPTAEMISRVFGYRPIEKAPLDLFRMASSRDKGISVTGPIGTDGAADYTIMVGDVSGGRWNTGNHVGVYGRIGYQLSPDVLLELYGDYLSRANGVEWTTLKGEAFLDLEPLVIGLLYASQNRTGSGTASKTIDVFSVYGEYELNDRTSPFVRVDVVGTEVPGADRIDFYRMSPDGKPTMISFGVRYKVSDNLELAPTWTTISYRGTGGVSPGSDSVFRMTFVLKF